MKRDFSVLIGIFVVSLILVVIANVVIDLLHTVLDPRMGANNCG